MSEDLLKELEEKRREREAAYTELRGIFKGIRLTRLNETEETFLRLIELMIDGFKNSTDTTDKLQEVSIHLFQLIEKLGKRITRLEQKVEQIERFQNTLEENR
jgi:hypothetical protein